jgi:predicted amidohydrolase
VGQLRSTSDKWSNLASVAVCAGRAKKQGARMLFLPENAGFLGSSARETVDQADPPTAQADPDAIRNDELVTRALREIVSKHALLPENDDLSGSGSSSSSSAVIPSCPVAGNEIVILDGLRTIAKESEMWLAGTIHVGGAPPSSAEKSQPSSTSSEDNNPASRVYNTHVVVDDQGRLAAEYNKIHLFDVEIPGQVAHRESASTAPGRAAVVCDSPVGTSVRSVLCRVARVLVASVSSHKLPPLRKPCLSHVERLLGAAD